MTKADDSCKSGGNRPAQEIEVTPEMIEAGLEELSEHRYGSDARYVLESVYRAMAYADLVRASSTSAVR